MDLKTARKNQAILLPEQLDKVSELSCLQLENKENEPYSDAICKEFPHTFNQGSIQFVPGKNPPSKSLKVGVVLSGGQAPGGHNVICGLYDALKQIHPESSLLGFLGGPQGILEANYKVLEAHLIDDYRNQGGFDLIGSGRTKIEGEKALQKALETSKALELDCLVVVGGDDSNTNAAHLAEYFMKQGCHTAVVGVPKTIDGDLKGKDVEVSFGFDTACKVYCELIGNIMKDALSAKKYYHFIRLMGRSASHIALECALQTHPNMTLIGEEIFQNKRSLDSIAQELVAMIIQRSKAGKNYGIVLFPEGVIEFIPQMKLLIGECNDLLAKDSSYGSLNPLDFSKLLSDQARDCYCTLPESIQKQLLLDRDPHGNVQVSKIETEKLFMELVKNKLKENPSGEKVKFNVQGHFFGYEGRSAYPSLFDCHYCTALGYAAALLARFQKSGYMATVKDLSKTVSKWTVGGVSIASMLNLEKRKGEMKAVIQKALVDLQGNPFLTFSKQRASWILSDDFQSPGPIQFYGDSGICHKITETLSLESQSKG